MKKLLVAVVCLGLFAAVANANTMHLYFSLQGNNAGIPAEYNGKFNPALGAGGGTMYLWAYVGTGDTWNGLALDIENATGGASPLYNPGIGGTNQRWNANSDLDWNPDKHVFGVAVQEWGLGNAIEPIVVPAYSVPGTRHYLVGEIKYAAGFNGAEYLHVGPQGIARVGGTPGVDGVYFGWTPGGAPDGPILGNAFGQKSQYPDIVPEPASLVLLGLAGLALRRR